MVEPRKIGPHSHFRTVEDEFGDVHVETSFLETDTAPGNSSKPRQINAPLLLDQLMNRVHILVFQKQQLE